MHFLIGGELDGQTPLDHDDVEGLIPSWVATRADLNLAEQENIAAAETWAAGRAFQPDRILTSHFIKGFHRRMFGDVWRWAGAYRQRNTNIGVDHWLVPDVVEHALGDGLYWIEHGTYAIDEFAVRLHHRLVQTHPFPNGNGRLSRSVADLLATSLDARPFDWGSALDPAIARATYIAALQSADRHDITPLVEFART